MKIIALILGVCFYSLAFSQQTYVNEVWNVSGSTQASHLRSISKTDLYGNVYVAGATFNRNDYDAYVRKYNSGGTIDWTYQYDPMKRMILYPIF